MVYAVNLEERGEPFIHSSGKENPWNYELFVEFRDVLASNPKIIGKQNADNIYHGWDNAYR